MCSLVMIWVGCGLNMIMCCVRNSVFFMLCVMSSVENLLCCYSVVSLVCIVSCVSELSLLSGLLRISRCGLLMSVWVSVMCCVILLDN